MPTPSYTKVADGNVGVCRFVTLSTSVVGRVTQATAGQQIYGVSQQQTRYPPYANLDDGYAAIQGESLCVYGPPAKEVMLKLGGTVNPGDRLKSDGSGQGVATTTTSDEVGAIASEAGTTGKLIRVQLVPPVQY